MLIATAASAAERILVLEVVINGRTTGRVGEFTDRDGRLYAVPGDLRQLGLVVPPEIMAVEQPIALSLLTGLRAELNEARQTLLLVADDAALIPTELGAGAPARMAPLSSAGFGLLLNYDAAVTFSARQTNGGAFLDARAFGPRGVLQNSAIVDVTPSPGQKAFIRLDTTFTHTQAEKMRRWRMGDVVTGALPWTRAVRLGGVQVASDFSIRPDLVTYPLPVISASAAVPSTVNVLVNGIRQISGSVVEPGPFAVRTLPVVTGAGEVAVTIADAIGRQTVITLPFYASTALLQPGLVSYSVEIGAVREHYGQRGDRYSGWAVNQSSRVGLTDWLTLESHAEAAHGLALLGVGGAIRVGTLGILNLSAAGSIGGTSSRHSGAMISAGFQRISPRLSFSLNSTYATAGYGDIAAEHGSPVPKWTLNASMGYRLGKWGSLGIAYNHRVSRLQPYSASRGSSHKDNVLASSDVKLITGSYSAHISRGATFYATGFKNLRQDAAYGLSLGINFALGGSTYATVQASRDSGRPTASINIARAAQEKGDFGYRLHYAEGTFSHLSAESEFVGHWGRLSGGVDYQSNQIAGRMGARGALVVAGGHVFASDRIDDSFAVVSSGDVAGVPVLYENRPVGKTDSHGRLLIPSLLSYQDNRLMIDTVSLPPDVEVGQSDMLIRPPDRSGVHVEFAVRKVNAALLTLHDRNGLPVPIGSVAKVQGVEDRPVGHDGEAYVTGLKQTNRMEVALPDGTTCVVQFDYRPVKGDIPLIGPLRCQ